MSFTYLNVVLNNTTEQRRMNAVELRDHIIHYIHDEVKTYSFIHGNERVLENLIQISFNSISTTFC